MLTAGETRDLLDAIDTGTLVGVTRSRLDRPHGVQLRTRERGGGDAGWPTTTPKANARSSACTKKAGKYLVVPAHHVGQAYIDEYIERAGIDGDRQGPLFRSSGQGRRQDVLLRSAMTRQTALKMIKRRAAQRRLAR